jgi:hypothetical protein
VFTVVGDKTPRTGAAEKVTVSPAIGFPFTVTSALIVDCISEPAAIVDGIASRVKSPEEIVIDIDCEVHSEVAVTVVVPVSNPGLSVAMATPLESVVAKGVMIVSSVVVKLTGAFGARIPIASRTVTDIVDVILEPAASVVGFADISINGSLTRTASKGIVCPYCFVDPSCS